ncbi:VOC family protein [Chitinophaga varians]|uniref:VOC family protein n=1 Tax=Chitinophaga varians TaxID=2202339 RepID=UPI00165F8CFA|nr:VOC family protein [Chitinophaga varians]MBC9909060.1 VOC family protein [Chitinophaga varians]
MKIAMAGVHVNDPLEAFRFYTEKLGFKEKVYMPEAMLAVVVSPEEPDGTTLLLEPSQHPVAKAYQEGLYAAGIPAIMLGTADIAAEYERLTAQGVVFRKPPTRADWGIEAVFEDECGNLIALGQIF